MRPRAEAEAEVGRPPTGSLWSPRFPLKGPFNGDINTGLDIDVGMDIDSDMAVSRNWGGLLKGLAAPLKGFGVDRSQV